MLAFRGVYKREKKAASTKWVAKGWDGWFIRTIMPDYVYHCNLPNNEFPVNGYIDPVALDALRCCSWGFAFGERYHAQQLSMFWTKYHHRSQLVSGSLRPPRVVKARVCHVRGGTGFWFTDILRLGNRNLLQPTLSFQDWMALAVVKDMTPAKEAHFSNHRNEKKKTPGPDFSPAGATRITWRIEVIAGYPKMLNHAEPLMFRLFSTLKLPRWELHNLSVGCWEKTELDPSELLRWKFLENIDEQWQL